MKVSHSRILPARLSGLFLCTVLSGCATTFPVPEAASVSGPSAWRAAIQALRSGEWDAAQRPLAQLVRDDLRNGHLQFLYAIAQEQTALKGSRSGLDLAEVGYTNAVKFSPGNFWAMMRLGGVALQKGDWHGAQAQYALAAMDQPDRWEAFQGLGVASYYLQDLPMMTLAVERALQLSPQQPELLRMQALAATVRGDSQASTYAQQAVLRIEEPAQAKHFERRLLEIAMTSSEDYEQIEDPAEEPMPVEGMGESGSITISDQDGAQVVIEVTLMLSSVLQDRARGVNLFDGLRVLYGYANALSRVTQDGISQTTRAITSEIASPQLDYSLNLFNNSGQYYNVVARPSITAHLGRPSEFFAGRTVNVGVSGLNVGEVKPIDVGVGLNVTPELIDDQRVRFQINATRAFLSQEIAGTFENTLTLFRQTVSATAEIEFGQTLVLSALSEQVKDKTYSKVPIAGDVPVLDWFTSNSLDSQRQESLLILVTPSLPARFNTDPRGLQRAEAVETLLRLWHERIDPRSDINAIMQRLQRSHWLQPPERGDLSLRVAADDIHLREALEENLLLARQ